jgi:predicted nucleic acid-binding protein
VIVVADASPLHYLILIEQIDLLAVLYRQVLVPDTVAAELNQPRTPEKVRDWIGKPPSWLRIEAAYGPTDDLLEKLDPGERDAIRLALAHNVHTLLIDDAEGRREASRRQLRVAGTLGILDRSAEWGLIDLRTELARLQTTNFRVRADLIESLLERDSARKSARAVR